MANSTIRGYHLPNEWKKKLQTEMEDWKEVLTSRVEENVLLKNNLADILKNNYDRNCLEEIEEFQTKSIQEDEIIRLLKMRISDLDQLCNSEKLENEDLSEYFVGIMSQFRKDMTFSGHSFGLLISDFKDFQQKACIYRKI